MVPPHPTSVLCTVILDLCASKSALAPVCLPLCCCPPIFACSIRFTHIPRMEWQLWPLLFPCFHQIKLHPCFDIPQSFHLCANWCWFCQASVECNFIRRCLIEISAFIVLCFFSQSRTANYLLNLLPVFYIKGKLGFPIGNTECIFLYGKACHLTWALWGYQYFGRCFLKFHHRNRTFTIQISFVSAALTYCNMFNAAPTLHCQQLPKQHWRSLNKSKASYWPERRSLFLMPLFLCSSHQMEWFNFKRKTDSD